MDIDHSLREIRFKKSRTIQIVLFLIIFELTPLPYPVHATETEAANLEISDAKVESVISEKAEVLEDIGALKRPEVAWSRKYTMTAYTSEVAQCDASPCITANGFNVCRHGIEDTVAANFLPFGTKIRIPALFGDRILIVRDRMNSRYQERVDVWLKSYDNAIDFGVKYVEIEVLK